jgi:hypothetical protein
MVWFYYDYQISDRETMHLTCFYFSLRVWYLKWRFGQNVSTTPDDKINPWQNKIGNVKLVVICLNKKQKQKILSK